MKMTLAPIPNYNHARLPWGDVAQARFTRMKKYKGGSERDNRRLNHESANTAGNNFFG
jgi:hypothetical protein